MAEGPISASVASAYRTAPAAFLRRAGTCILQAQISGAPQCKKEQDREQLLVALRQRGCGSLLRGWRCELDRDGVLEVNFQDFCKAAGRLGYRGDVYSLVRSDKGRWSLTLAELAPEAMALVDRFMTWVKDTFGGPVEMFSALSKDTPPAPSSKDEREQPKRVTAERFFSAIRERGFQGTDSELAELFNSCDVHSVGSLTREDVICLEMDKKVRELETFKLRMRRAEQQQQLMMSMYSEGRQMPAKHRLAARPWQAGTFDQLPAVVCERRADWRRATRRRGVVAKAVFMRHLRETYGNEVRAWRRGLDIEMKFRVHLIGLRSYCSTKNLSLDVAALWKNMDKDSDGVFELEELCPKYADELASFRHWAHEKFGSCAAIWDCKETAWARWGPQRGGTWVSDKKILLESFSEALQQLDCPIVDDARAMVLASLDLYGCGFVSCSDFEWLDGWQPPQWLCTEADPAAWQTLRAMILREYQHPLRAWRALLDKDDSNNISWCEFRRACKQIGFRGNVGGAWRMLDTDHSGSISMAQYDEESAEILGSFKEWTEKNFGSAERAFRALDVDNDGTISYSELKHACQKLKWEGSVRALFHGLGGGVHSDGPCVGKRGITLDDIAFLDTWQAAPSKEELQVESECVSSLTAPAVFRKRSNSLPSPDLVHKAVAHRRGSAPPDVAESAFGNPLRRSSFSFEASSRRGSGAGLTAGRSASRPMGPSQVGKDKPTPSSTRPGSASSAFGTSSRAPSAPPMCDGCDHDVAQSEAGTDDDACSTSAALLALAEADGEKPESTRRVRAAAISACRGGKDAAEQGSGLGELKAFAPYAGSIRAGEVVQAYTHGAGRLRAQQLLAQPPEQRRQSALVEWGLRAEQEKSRARAVARRSSNSRGVARRSVSHPTPSSSCARSILLAQ
eukprot:gnl/TRDRNA2_/TRDRNA2_175702_c0_seq1.p1 gnl/TRDRNA2_/TRDRNA2_175702_c0~~gnl/TRDRNA2_/TRDRNA2_175702_c0_seq1.p1  ORF type:complete len:909 (-),score=149.85 gnl/TRDRNA2_/TRDRNA2_175702_c0_seq1:51-2777(-)